MTNKPTFSEQVATRLIEQLKAGTAPWQRPWQADSQGFLPYNPTTGKRYKGINTVWLMSQDHEDSRWLTYKQALAEGGQVKQGEKGSVIQYWKFADELIQRDEQGNPIKNQNGETIKATVKLERPQVFHAVVFNAEQIDGLPPAPFLERHWDPIERAEAIFSVADADVRYLPGNKAFYSPTQDFIQLPLREQFATADSFYATALHELGHWTGHESRLHRDLHHPFGSVAYAKEELRAEIASMILGSELGIGHDIGQHAAYVASWIQLLEDDQLELFRAAADAEKIYSYVLALEQTQDQYLTQETAMSDQPLQSDAQPMTMISTAILTEQLTKQYLTVPFKEKDEAKARGAKWDRQAGAWFITDDLDPQLFERWRREPSSAMATLSPLPSQGSPEAIDSELKTYLAVPYVERQQVKILGAHWDKAVKSWYTTETDLSGFVRWLPEHVPHTQAPAMSVRDEFAEVLRSVHCSVTGEHPFMDGEKHRIAVDGDKRGEKSGFYVAHIDGHPAGYVINNRTGVNIKWKSKGYSLSEEEKARCQAEAALKQQARSEAVKNSQQATATVLKQFWDVALPATDDHPYLIQKQVSGTGLRQVPAYTDGLPEEVPILIGADLNESKILRQENEHNPAVLVFTAGDLLVPVQDADGQIWSLQTIDATGTKRFARGGRKEGCFYVEGGLDALQKAPAVVIAEGMATAKSVSICLGFPVVSAFDSGNLGSVAKSLHQRYPDKPFIMAGDDDRSLEAKQGMNVGKIKAEAAAELVGGTAIFPVFAGDEAGLTDFNDLATQSVYGREGLDRQVKTVVALAIEKHTLPIKPVKDYKQDFTPRQELSRAV